MSWLGTNLLPRRGRVARWCRLAGSVAMVMAATVVLWPSVVLAQGAPVPNPPPNASIPGHDLIIDILGWLKWGALASAVAGLLIGGIATAVGYTGAHYGASSAGRRWLLGGLGAAVIAGLAHMLVQTLYEAAS